MWTRFMDMHSGWWRKQDREYIYIEAWEEEAKVIFYNRFWANPDRITCTCCGSDYSISEEIDLLQATAYERWCDYDSKLNSYIETKKSITIEKYIKNGSVLVIYAKDIKDEERKWEIPEQWYVRVD